MRVKPPLYGRGMKRHLIVLISCLLASLLCAASASAMPYFELSAPSGSYSGKTPKGWVMIVHGGGWDGVGQGQVEKMRPEAHRFTDRGWATMNVTYTAGGQSLADVAGFYDVLRSKYSGKICLFGSSAGGQLVLMTAAARPTVSCVITEGAPTNLPAFAYQTAYDPATKKQQTGGPQFVYGKAVSAFGVNNLSFYSPLTWASKINMPVLMSMAKVDALVPAAQMKAMHDARPTKVKAVTLASSATSGSPYTHAYLTTAGRKSWEASKSAFLLKVR